MGYDLILRNARIADNGPARPNVDIAVAGGRIVAIGSAIAGEGESIDAGGKLVSPGLVECQFSATGRRIWAFASRCSRIGRRN